MGRESGGAVERVLAELDTIARDTEDLMVEMHRTVSRLRDQLGVAGRLERQLWATREKLKEYRAENPRRTAAEHRADYYDASSNDPTIAERARARIDQRTAANLAARYDPNYFPSRDDTDEATTN